MILRINLLATKAAKKHLPARNELYVVAGLLATIVVGLGMWHVRAEARLSDVRASIDTVRHEIDQLKQDVVRVEDFKTKAEVLERKLQVIDTLQQQRVGPAKLLDDLSTILTDEKKVWLVRLSEKDGTLTLEGGAMEHENISDFQLALERRSKFFKNISLTLVESAATGGVPYLQWKMTCTANYSAG